MGTSHLKHHQNLSGPVKGATRALLDDLQVLVREGPPAYIEALRNKADLQGELAGRIVVAVAAAIEDYCNEEVNG